MLVARGTPRRLNHVGHFSHQNFTSRRSRGSRSSLPRVNAKSSKSTTEEGSKDDEPKITLKGLSQLIAMGLGSPLSGDLKEINLNDPKRTVVFELDANNFEDADGNPISQGKVRVSRACGCVQRFETGMDSHKTRGKITHKNKTSTVTRVTSQARTTRKTQRVFLTRFCR